MKAELVSSMEAVGLVLDESRPRPAWTVDERRQLSPFETSKYTSAIPNKSAARILQLTYYDPGSAVYRYHSAFNTNAKLASAFARWYHQNPHCDLRQFDGETELLKIEQLFVLADVIHVHMDYRTLYHAINRLPEKHQVLVRHYHGSILPGDPAARPLVDNEKDGHHEAIQVGARLYHKRFSDRMVWLPIPMPIKDYEIIAAKEYTPRANRPFLLAHSPTNRAIKGSSAVEDVVRRMQQRGTDINLVSIEGMTHAKALRAKAGCDATFDSFWLGIQGSGLEAASMGQMVIAGDAEVREEYKRELGECPYTFAGDAEQLEAVLQKAVDDDSWRKSEAARAGEYVRKWHSYEKVAKIYAEIIQRAVKAKR